LPLSGVLHWCHLDRHHLIGGVLLSKPLTATIISFDTATRSGVLRLDGGSEFAFVVNADVKVGDRAEVDEIRMTVWTPTREPGAIMADIRKTRDNSKARKKLFEELREARSDHERMA
jgi:hypothetical protein